jgi:hypothetical protein
VLYLRERNPFQEKLLETQEASLGIKRETNLASVNKSSKNEERLIEKTLTLLEKENPGMKTYRSNLDYNFKTEFKHSFPTFILMITVLFIMTFQLFGYLNLDNGLMRQNWLNNKRFNQNSTFKLVQIQSYIQKELENAMNTKKNLNEIGVASIEP